MNLSKYHQGRIVRHRQLWDWCFHNPEKEKDDWPEWERNGGQLKEIEADCFLCEIADGIAEALDSRSRSPLPCSEVCPLFPTTPIASEKDCLGGLHVKWSYHLEVYGRWEMRKKYAKMIRDLPIRE